MNRRAASILWPAAALAAIVWLIPQAVFAHGFGEKYDLPVPLSFFVTGAGLAVALSFIIVAVFVRRNTQRNGLPAPKPAQVVARKGACKSTRCPDAACRRRC